MRLSHRVLLTSQAALVVALIGCSTAPLQDFAEANAVVTSVAPARRLAVADAATEDLGPLLAPLAENAGLPGLAAAVLADDRIAAEGVTGVRRRGGAERVTLEDQWEISSCAKAMSATLIARLVADGALAWDRPLPAYFAGEPVHAAWGGVTLRHLLTHTAGVRDPIGAFLANTYFVRGPLPQRRADFARGVLRAPPAAAPGGDVRYNNTDYILAAVMAERATGSSWEKLMADRVFGPMGLASAGFGPPGQPGRVTQPWGHGKHRVLQLGVAGAGAFDPGARGADYPAMASPAGYIHVSLRDWTEFVARHLRGDASNPHRTCVGLGPDTYDELHALRAGVSYAGGWFVGQRSWAKGSRREDTGRVLYHIGNNGRWTSAVWIAPEVNFAVVVVCNEGDKEAAVDRVASTLLDKYLHRTGRSEVR